MSTANQELYEELKFKMGKFLETASSEEIKRSFDGIDVEALLRTSAEASGSWTMLLQEAPGPSNGILYSLSEEMTKTYQFGDFDVAANHTLALAA